MMKTLTENVSLEDHLINIIEQEPDTIRAKVAEEAIHNVEYYPIKSWFNDLLSHGCICGFVGSLIYYRDTHKFFDDHYYEIDELRTDWEDAVGVPFIIKNDLKNDLAWFGFEETARLIADELGLDV